MTFYAIAILKSSVYDLKFCISNIKREFIKNTISIRVSIQFEDKIYSY